MVNFIDPMCVQDELVTALALVEDLGGVFRFSYVSSQQGELILVKRVCLLTHAVQSANVMTVAAMLQSEHPMLNALRTSH